MTFHKWGDENVDWAGIDAAAYEIAHYLARWGRIQILQYKEKFGTVRVYMCFGGLSGLSILYPFEHYFRGYRPPHPIDRYVLTPVLSKLEWLTFPYQRWIYRKAYAKAIAKRPHLTNEILDGADCPGLLDGLRPLRRRE